MLLIAISCSVRLNYGNGGGGNAKSRESSNELYIPSFLGTIFFKLASYVPSTRRYAYPSKCQREVAPKKRNRVIHIKTSY